MEKKLVKLIGKLLLLCAVLTFSIGSAKAYAEEKVKTGFELIDENNDSITEPIDFILEDSEGVKQEYQSMFGYLILDVFENKLDKEKTNIIIAKTIKGKGISFMENKNTWHRKSTK